jgi:hypothetical protein
MKLKQKYDIINDLVKFKMGKEYYAKIGKSTMIAAMAIIS